MRFIGNSNLLANTAVFVEQCGYYGISVQMPLLDEKRFTYRPLTPALHSDILLVWRRDRQQSLALQKFLQFAKCFLFKHRISANISIRHFPCKLYNFRQITERYLPFLFMFL